MSVSSVNLQTFMVYANTLRTKGVPFNYVKMRNIDVFNSCMVAAEQILGSDMDYLKDALTVRAYINEIYGREDFFQSEKGTIELDIPHSVLFYHYLNSVNPEMARHFLGVLYFIAGHQLEDEWNELEKRCRDKKVYPVIKPLFDMNPKYFRWKSCNQVLRRYMVHFAEKEGYRSYYFERRNVNLIVFLMNLGYSFEEAESLADKGGLFYSFLPSVVENTLVEYILSGHMSLDLLDGWVLEKFDVNEVIMSLDPNDDREVYYNTVIKPNLIEMTGMVLNTLKQDIARGGITPDDVIVFHLAPSRVGVFLREGLDIREVLPMLGKHFIEVEDLDLSMLPHGYFN